MSFQPHARINSSQLIAHLQSRASEAEKRIETNFPEAHTKFRSLNLSPKNLRRHATNLIASTLTAGTLLASGVANMSSPVPHAKHEITRHAMTAEQMEQKIAQELPAMLPANFGQLSDEQAQNVKKLLKETLGINATNRFEGNQLNHAYGRVGGEQHLPRFPGDTISQHDEYQKSGITPGRSAWGYFANSKAELTEDLIQKEKYYVAVQTLYLPEWNTNTKYLKDWYKHREVIVINPTTGKSVVAVIADAGPAKWTGKHFGGSPEVMQYLQLYKDGNNGKALLLFVDDKENRVALGPVDSQVGTATLASN